MTEMIDVSPAARRMARLLSDLSDDQLSAPTPCAGTSLGDLIDHVGGLSQAFTDAARKNLGPGTAQGPSADAARLGADWRTRIPEQGSRSPRHGGTRTPWTGMTQVGGVDLPGDMAGRIALNELVIHGWASPAPAGSPTTAASRRWMRPSSSRP